MNEYYLFPCWIRIIPKKKYSAIVLTTTVRLFLGVWHQWAIVWPSKQPHPPTFPPAEAAFWLGTWPYLPDTICGIPRKKIKQ